MSVAAGEQGYVYILRVLGRGAALPYYNYLVGSFAIVVIFFFFAFQIFTPKLIFVANTYLLRICTTGELI